jgi:predicted CoA-binding protein
MSIDLKQTFGKYKTIAIVGLSKDPSKDSYKVAMYLKSQGFRILPVNPSANEILGEKVTKVYLTCLRIYKKVWRSLTFLGLRGKCHK